MKHVVHIKYHFYIGNHPYGKPIESLRTGIGMSPYMFGGKERDEMLGINLMNFEARSLDDFGRFTTVDPMAEKYYSISPYAYCGNNPIRYTDPTGMFLTNYHNDKGELLYHTDDGLDDVIIVPDLNIPMLEDELQMAQDNGTINNPETNKSQMHILGYTPEQYTNQKIEGMGSDWIGGYASTYKPTYKGERISLLDRLIAFVAGVSEEYRMMQGGRKAGEMDGERDRKDGKIDRLDPRSSLKKNAPLLQLERRKEIILYVPSKKKQNGKK